MDLAWDRVSCELSARRTVPTDTVRVYVQGTVTQGDQESAKLQDTLAQALQPVLKGTWNITSASRIEDEAGMERVRLVATIRVPENQTSGLVDRLRKSNRPGLKLALMRIEYRPPHKTIDAILRELRQEIYKEAEIEAKLLNASLPSDTIPWRVGAIQLTEDVDELKALMRASPRRRADMTVRSVNAYRDEDEDEEEPEPVSSAGIMLEMKGRVTLCRLTVPLSVYAEQVKRERGT